MRSIWITMITGYALMLVLLPVSATAVTTSFGLTTKQYVRAKAQPDECWRGLGNNTPFLYPPCDSAGVPKVNQGYVWALVDTGDEVWFGTVSNPQCLTAGVFGIEPDPYETGSWACEFGSGPFPQLPASIGDFRAPQIFVYTKATGDLEELTPQGPITLSNPWGIHPLVLQTAGFRAAGQLGDLILFAGSALAGGVNVFAFNRTDRSFIGSLELEQYNNIRSFVAYDGFLYSPMSLTDGGGSILKWTGTVSESPCESCFTHEEVGVLEVGGAAMAEHNGRFFVTTWPSKSGPEPTGLLASLVMSPPIPEGGLSVADNESWTTVWDVSEFEPDPVIAQAYGGGALMSYGDYLFFGTMHVPLLATELFFSAYGEPADEQGMMEAFAGTFRTATLFRGRNFTAVEPDIDLLYGNTLLPVYNAPDNETPGFWSLAANNTGLPLYGSAGFNNPWNNYTWSMAVWDGRLWVGMMDWSYMAAARAAESSGIYGNLLLPSLFENSQYGADLFFFPCPSCPALPESQSGVGNYANYGVRTMATTPDSLFLGMANPMNLLTDLADDLPEGGWELLELAKLTRNTPAGTNVSVTLDNGVTVVFYRVERAGVTTSSFIANPYRDNGGAGDNLLLNYFNTAGRPPAVPPGTEQPDELITLYSSAAWDNATDNGTLAQVCVPAGPCSVGLYQLRFSGLSGYFWKDITVQLTGDRVCGEIENDFMGILGVFLKACPDNGLFCDGPEICDTSGTCSSAGSPCGNACDESTDVCVDCLTDADCSGNGFCLANTCVQCIVDRNCDDGDPCTTDVCAVGPACRNIAISGCTNCTIDEDCGVGQVCRSGTCENVQTNSGGGNNSGGGAQTSGPELSVIDTITLDGTARKFPLVIELAAGSSGTLNWKIGTVTYDTDNMSWITGITPASGTATVRSQSLVVVKIDPDPLPPGRHTATIPVTSNGGNEDVTVVLNIEERTTTTETNSNTTTSIPPPAVPNCTLDEDCDDGVFCNGAERCIEGICSEPPAPACSETQVCREVLGVCMGRRQLQAFSIQSRLWRPRYRGTRCIRLALRSGVENNFRAAESTLSLVGPAEGAEGVMINPDKSIVKAGDVILIPLCIEQTATTGTWKLSLETDVEHVSNPFIELMEYSFTVY